MSLCDDAKLDFGGKDTQNRLIDAFLADRAGINGVDDGRNLSGEVCTAEHVIAPQEQPPTAALCPSVYWVMASMARSSVIMIPSNPRSFLKIS